MALRDKSAPCLGCYVPTIEQATRRVSASFDRELACNYPLLSPFHYAQTDLGSTHRSEFRARQKRRPSCEMFSWAGAQYWPHGYGPGRSSYVRRLETRAWPTNARLKRNWSDRTTLLAEEGSDAENCREVSEFGRCVIDTARTDEGRDGIRGGSAADNNIRKGRRSEACDADARAVDGDGDG
eukprot:3025583-Pleurochrysis_carterae.AAC.3